MHKPMVIYRGWTRKQKTGFWLATAILLYTLFGFLVAPPIVKAVLEKKLPEILQRPVRIEKIRLNPYALSATVEGFRLGHKDAAGVFVSFARLYVNLESLSLFKKALIVQALSLEKPTFDVSRLDEQTFNFSDLLTAPAPAEPQAAEAEPAHFSINNIQIRGGEIRFHDLPKGVDHRIDQLKLSIPSISNLPTQVQVTVQPLFAAVINGASLALDGGSKPFAASRATEVALKISGINLLTYLAYIPNPTGLTIKSALLDLDTRIAYQLFPNQSSRLSVTGSATLRELEVVGRDGGSYLRVPSISLALADTNLLNKEVRLAELTVTAPQFDLQRLPSGELLPLGLLTPAGGAEAGESVAAAGEPAAGPPLSLTIDRFRLDRGKVTFTDQALEAPATLLLSDLTLAADNLSTIPDTQGTVSLALLLNQSGQVSADGSLMLEPLVLKTGLSLKALQLKDFQSYVLQQAKLVLASGSLTVKGDLAFRQPEGGNPVLTFAGDSSIDGLATADTVTGADLLKWQALELKGIRFALQPVTLALDEILLKDSYVQVLVNDDGTVNLATLSRGQPEVTTAEPAATETEAVAAERPKITIGKVVLNNGKVEFQDRNIQPSYGLKLDQLSGSVTGLSSDLEQRATVAISARVDQQAPLTISGTTNPLSAEPFADIKIDFKHFNLPPLSPYSGKYIGKKTSKGKLNLDLAYRIEGHQLASRNRVLLDQFTLGEPVTSPDATTLPVGLAIALLKDRHGLIDLDIPVSGDLNDPEFRVGGVIVQVIVNLIAKAATSPFALLGALIPEGEDIQFIPFDPGSAAATEVALGKLGVVANVLHERPGLKMEISGRVDRQLDRETLARNRMLQRIKLEKLQKSGVKKTSEKDIQAVGIGPEEYPIYLKLAYAKALEATPQAERDAARQLKPASPAEETRRMERFFLAGIQIEDEELRLLALDRANQVLGYLVEAGKVEAGRLFVVEPQLPPADAAGEATPQTLVALSIK